MYGEICGAKQEECERLLELLNLQKHASTPSGVLSGGNKRKLSLGIALVTLHYSLYAPDLDLIGSGLQPKSVIPG